MEGDKMRLRGLLQPLQENNKFITVINSIKNRRFPINIAGLSESGKSYVIDGIFNEIDNSLVIVTHNELEAKNLYEDLSLYSTNVYFLPIREVVFYNVDAISGDLRWARLKVIKEILNNKDKKIIVTSVDAITALYTPRQKYLNYSITIKNGDEVDLKDISKKLIECGYERVEVVEGKGEFSFRGGILDVFPPIAIYPYRIELFGDEIDSIRTFNIESQRSIEKVKSIEIFPAKEVIVDEEGKKSANDKIISELDSIIEKSNNKNNDQVDKIKRIVNKNLEMLNETSTFETVDSYLPFFYEEMESLFDYLDGYTFIIDDLKRLELTPNNLYNFHPGSHVKQGADVGIKYITDMLNQALTKEQTTTVLLETMSGKGTEVGRNFEELKAIIDGVELDEKLGVCLDTCHVFDAGYDIVNDLDGVLERFDNLIGLDRLKAIHLNDSLNSCGSHKDRHARIGEGQIGLDAIVRIINHDALKHLPFLLETPNELDGYAREIELLKSKYNG